MGIPVASFSTGGIPEAVEHNKTGLLAGTGNIKELATNIHTLLNNELMWKEFSENAIKRTLTDFDISKQTNQLENIFLEILSKDSKL
jgi:glycosyltransferase involved in cell wall biosynthesis